MTDIKPLSAEHIERYRREVKVRSIHYFSGYDIHRFLATIDALTAERDAARARIAELYKGLRDLRQSGDDEACYAMPSWEVIEAIDKMLLPDEVTK